MILIQSASSLIVPPYPADIFFLLGDDGGSALRAPFYCEFYFSKSGNDFTARVTNFIVKSFIGC